MTTLETIPVGQMKGLADVLRSAETQRLMQSVNSAFDAGFAMSCLNLIQADQTSNPSKYGKTLADCAPDSIVGSLMTCAHANLYPLHPQSVSKVGMYFVPFWNSKRGCNVATLIPSYQALVDMAYRHQMAEVIKVGIIHEGDEFEMSDGFDSVLHHKISLQRGAPIGGWAYALSQSGQKTMEYLSWDEILQRAPKKDDGSFQNPVWKQFPKQMAHKTLLRSICRQLPPVPQVAQMMMRDITPMDDSAKVETLDMDAVTMLDAQDVADSKPAKKPSAKKPALQPQKEPAPENPPETERDFGDDLAASGAVTELLDRVTGYKNRGVEAKKITNLMREPLEKLKAADPKGHAEVVKAIEGDGK